jgi:diguanylate cyclase (GGDEF)-like protein
VAAAALLVALTAGSYSWNAEQLLVIAALAVFSDLTAVEVPGRVRLSGSFLGIVLASTLLGGGPAAVIGFLTIAIGWFRWREPGHQLLNNIATFIWFPLLAGIFFHSAVHLGHLSSSSVGFYLLVFVAFVVALALNFLAIAGYRCYLDRSSLSHKTREALIPVLSAELFSALLTIVAVYVAVQLGIVFLVLFAIVLVVFQHLVGELLLSQRRSKELHRMATIDDLTGLANREHFRATIDAEIAAAADSRKQLSVILMDLDRFKEVNDALGHDYGDLLLKELGARFKDSVGPGGMVARLGGDEFAFFPGPYTDDAELERFAKRLLELARKPITVQEGSLELDASVGIARFPQDGSKGHELLRRADLAMYAAKEAQTGFMFYSPEQDLNSAQRLDVLRDFRRALSDGEIVVHYQPIVDLHDLVVTGAEALVRWEHPEKGLMPPMSFIPAVEQSGLIIPLTHYVLDRAIAQCAQWRRSGHELSVSVNLSVRNLLDRELPREVERLLSFHSLPPEALHLEITESMIMSDPERAMATVTRLSALGVQFSVDDFGTGYSSLANLRKLPGISELKIDRSFVSPMLKDEKDLTIVRSTINLGHDLGLRVVAEGVEDERTLMRLAMLGADLAQGFHLSKPLAPDAFDAWMGQPRYLVAAAAG